MYHCSPQSLRSQPPHLPLRSTSRSATLSCSLRDFPSSLHPQSSESVETLRQSAEYSGFPRPHGSHPGARRMHAPVLRSTLFHRYYSSFWCVLPRSHFHRHPQMAFHRPQSAAPAQPDRSPYTSLWFCAAAEYRHFPFSVLPRRFHRIPRQNARDLSLPPDHSVQWNDTREVDQIHADPAHLQAPVYTVFHLHLSARSGLNTSNPLRH